MYSVVVGWCSVYLSDLIGLLYYSRYFLIFLLSGSIHNVKWGSKVSDYCRTIPSILAIFASYLKGVFLGENIAFFYKHKKTVNNLIIHWSSGYTFSFKDILLTEKRKPNSTYCVTFVLIKYIHLYVFACACRESLWKYKEPPGGP